MGAGDGTDEWGGQVTLLALWDGKAEGDARGGTADMVKIARDAGGIDVQVIDAARLLAGPVGAGTSA